MKNTSTGTFLLWLILIMGAFLRLYDLGTIPFMHDELSAIHRLHYSSFSSLIESGVKPDGHPAGVQVFLFYYAKLAGTSEAAIKFPFLALGILSIWVTYKLGRLWFGETASLLVAASVATLQFHVFYSQLARPYISGYFFSIMMVYYWSKYLFGEKRGYRELAGFVVFATLSCYNHYFSHLFAIIVSITGLFFLKKKNALPYLVSGAAIFILYLPHLGIFLHHYHVGGLGGEGGWLGKPREDFLGQFIRYIFHYSPPVYIVILVLLIAGIFTLGKNEFIRTQKFRLISLAWFLLPFLIGYYYSLHVNPVLQYAILFFSFPYLLFFLFSFFRDVENKWVKPASVLLLLTATTTSLIYTREHYTVFYRQPFKQYALYASGLMKAKGEKNVQCSFNTDTDYVNYYYKKHTLPWSDSWKFNPEISPAAFREQLHSFTSDYFICDNLPFEYLETIQDVFPYLLYHEKGFTYDIHCFSKNTADQNKQVDDPDLYSVSLSFDKPDTTWQYNKDMIRKDSTGNLYYHMDENSEWGPTHKIMFGDCVQSRHNILLLSLAVKKTGKDDNGMLVMILENEKGEALEWRGMGVERCVSDSGKWVNVYLGYRLADLFKSTKELKGVKLSFYFWNKDKKKIDLDNFRFRVKEGNRYIYGLYEDIN